MEEERREEENQRQFGGESHFLDYLVCGCNKIRKNKENVFCALCFERERESEWCRLYYVLEYIYIGKRCELRL